MHTARNVATTAETRVLFPRDQEKLIADRGDFKYAALLLTLYPSGMRAGEVARLKREHFYPDLSGLAITKSKNGEQRRIVLPSFSVKLLKRRQGESPTPKKTDRIFFRPFDVSGDQREGDRSLRSRGSARTLSILIESGGY